MISFRRACAERRDADANNFVPRGTENLRDQRLPRVTSSHLSDKRRALRCHSVLEPFDTVRNNGTTAFFLLLNSYPVKEGPGSEGAGVKIGNAHRLADD